MLIQSGPEYDSIAMALNRDLVSELVKTMAASSMSTTGLGENEIFTKVMDILPPSLYLGWVRHKESALFYSHAWGAARVTSDKDGKVPFPVDSLKVTLEMFSPAGKQTDHKSGRNVWEVSVDAKYAGTTPVFELPKCTWMAEASHLGYGSWTNSSEW